MTGFQELRWVLKSKKIEKVTDQLIDAYQLEPEKTNFNERKLKKLKEPETYLNCIDYKIDLNWIDVNNHMNNIYYLELADMILPKEVRKSNNFSNFEILSNVDCRIFYVSNTLMFDHSSNVLKR